MQVYEAASISPDMKTISDVYEGAAAMITPPKPILSSYFTFSARNMRTGKAASVNKLVPTLKVEKRIFDKRAKLALHRRTQSAAKTYSGVHTVESNIICMHYLFYISALVCVYEYDYV